MFPPKYSVTSRDDPGWQAATCQMLHYGAPCLSGPVSWWQAGCMHEHVSVPFGICTEHVPLLSGIAWQCASCALAAGKPHERCPVTVRAAQAAPS
jgi:hypothetical protein